MIVVPVLIPLIAACVVLLLRRLAVHAAIAAALLTGAAAVAVALSVARRGPLVYDLGGWSAPLGISLRADGLSAVMLLMAASVALPVTLYAAALRTTRPEAGSPLRPEFWPLALLLLGGLNGIFLSADIFNLYVALELTTLSAVALVVVGEDDAALAAAIRYLLAAFVGSMFYLLGVSLLYARYGTLDLAGLTDAMRAEPASYLAAAAIGTALALKSALFPLHFWLPRAHAAAPAPVSALLSSLVVTSAFYLLLRLWTGVFSHIAAPAAGQAIGALGACAIVWGSLQALRQQRLKVMIAYSTVAQVGYLFLLIPLLTAALADPLGSQGWAASAWNGGIYHAITHALAKAAMFLSAGALATALGTDRIVGISGIAERLPVATYAFGIAGMTLIGLPPSGGFVAKWLLLTASLESGQWWWAVVMFAGGILTAGYVFLVLGQELSHADTDREAEIRPVPRMMEYCAFALAVAALVLGVRVAEPLALLTVGFPFALP